jgi:transcriptional regulator with XRE-family HTH domain
LPYDFRVIVRAQKKAGLSDGAVADRAGVSRLTYIKIRRGSLTVEIGNVERVVKALKITMADVYRRGRR